MHPDNPKNPVIVSKWISILYRQFQIYFNTHLKADGVTSAEYFYLLALYHEDGLSQETLSCRLAVDKAATARAVKVLETKAFVIRKKDPTDGRVNHVFLTEAGWALKSKILPVLDAWNALISEDMSKEEVTELSNKLEALTIKVRHANTMSSDKENQNE